MIQIYRQRFGEHIPLIRRQDVKGFVQRRPMWLVRPLGIHAVRKQVEIMELETRNFYERAMQQVSDAGVRKLLGDLADAERKHSTTGQALEQKPQIHGNFSAPPTPPRGRPWLRGLASGLMTTAGGIGHTLPFLIADFRFAFRVAVLLQVMLGGMLVFIAGLLIGNS